MSLIFLLWPFFRIPVSNSPSGDGDAPDVAVCGAPSSLVQVIDVPAVTEIASETNKKSLMSTLSAETAVAAGAAAPPSF